MPVELPKERLHVRTHIPDKGNALQKFSEKLMQVLFHLSENKIQIDAGVSLDSPDSLLTFPNHIPKCPSDYSIFPQLCGPKIQLP